MSFFLGLKSSRLSFVCLVTDKFFLKLLVQGLFIPFGVLIQGSSDAYDEPWLGPDKIRGTMEKRSESSAHLAPIRRSQKVLTRGWWDPKRGKISNFEQVM